ncbi:hypothetical protein [Streptomyces sp. NPDC007369]|uniref:hypothetical protein n=1 Tax=Streptomyces sp. NPDC007369 TaxID=3154589 RepID=UPI0033F82F9C
MPTIKIRGPLTVKGVAIRCPGRGSGDVPRELTLISNGAAVSATCGEQHRPRPGERRSGPRAQCFFPVAELTAANLGVIAQGKPGRFRLTLPGGGVVEGTLAATGGAQTGSTASRAAAAVNAKSGGTATPAAPAKPAGRATGGAMTAAFGAVAAVAGAVGQVAGAAGQMAGAVGQVATAGASAVESAASLGREGVGAARDGIREAGAYGERRHERKMRGGDGGGDE